jgi:uncharacterized protein YkwD
MKSNKTDSNNNLKQDIVTQHNLIRLNPKSYIPLLETQLKYFKGKILTKPGEQVSVETQEGASAVKECIEVLKKQKACGELTFDSSLSNAAQDHADDIGPNGSCDHYGSDGSDTDGRISKYLEWDVTISENLDFGATTAEDVIISLIVDDGVSDRGHRANIFNTKVKFIGVGLADHAEYSVCTVLDYCGGIKSYKNGSTSKGSNKIADMLKNKYSDSTPVKKVTTPTTTTTTTSTGNFSKLKQEIADQHNLIRTNPKSYVPILEAYSKLFKGKILTKPGENVQIETFEGANAVKECIEYLKKQKVVGKLTFDKDISKASQEHADDIGGEGILDHTGSDGSTTDQRVSRYIEWNVTLAENIDCGGKTAEDVMINLIVDDGNEDRGHRENIFNSEIKYIGVGYSKHKEYEFCTVLDYVGDITKRK